MLASISAKIQPELKDRLDAILKQEKITANHFINEVIEKAVIAKEHEYQADRRADAILAERIDAYYANQAPMMDWTSAKQDLQAFVANLHQAK